MVVTVPLAAVGLDEISDVYIAGNKAGFHKWGSFSVSHGLKVNH